MESVLEFRDLSKTYTARNKPVKALDGVSFRFRRASRPPGPQRRRQDHHRQDRRGLISPIPVPSPLAATVSSGNAMPPRTRWRLSWRATAHLLAPHPRENLEFLSSCGRVPAP